MKSEVCNSIPKAGSCCREPSFKYMDGLSNPSASCQGNGVMDRNTIHGLPHVGNDVP